MARRAQLILVTLLVLAFGAGPAVAAVGDPDPAFGTGGVALVPGTDRLHGQGAPLVQQDGRIVATSLLPGDVLFLSRFTAHGQPDTTFGAAAGTALTSGTDTGIRAPLKRAATGLAPDGRILVAGGSSSGGTITVGRFTADGLADQTFNGTGRLAVALKGKGAMLPTAMLVRPDGSALVTVLGEVGGKYGFTVVRITPAGRLDTTWGAAKGWVQVPIGTKPAAAFDLAELGTGGFILVGGVLDAAFTNPTDTAIVKLTAAGAPDPGFGTGGVVRQDLSAAESFDGAFGVTPLQTGGFFVTGPSGSQGMVARFTSTGALDAAFGTGGTRYTGLAPAGSRFIPVDVQLDGSGRVVVAGTVLNYGGVSTATRWGVTSLEAAGTAVRFSTAPEHCANRYARGPSGVSIVAHRILVAGSCNDKGTSAVMALVNKVFEPALVAKVDTTQAPSGYDDIRLDALDAAALLSAAQTLQASPFRSGAFANAPFRSGTLASSPFRSGTFETSPFRSGPFRSGPFRSGDLLSQIPLSDIPLKDGRSWSELLSPPLDQAPLQTITLGQVIDLPALSQLTFDDFDFTRTPLADLSLAALLLYPVPVSQFPPPTGGQWPNPDMTFLDLELQGEDLTEYYRGNLRLAGVDFSQRAGFEAGLGRSILAQVSLADVDLSKTPLKDVDPGSATDLGQLLQGLPRTGSVNPTLGEVLLAFLDADDLPFERAPRRQLLDAADLRDTELLTYTADYAVDCPAGPSLLEVALPGDARYVPDSSNLGEPRGSGPLTFDPCAGRAAGEQTGTLTFKAEPGSALGPSEATMRLVGTTIVRPLTLQVTDDDRDGATLEEGLLLTGHIADAGDVDEFRIAAPPIGSRVTFTLSQLTADLDLEVAGPTVDGAPTASPFRSGAFQSSPFRSGPVGDPTGDPADTEVTSPNAVQDAPFRSGDERRGISVKRGTADESVTVVSRAGDQGEDFVLRVAGFDGASARDAYVVRAIVSEAAPPKTCIPIREGLGSGPAGSLPQDLPAGTRTLVLVNQQRMAALYGAAATETMLDRIRSTYLGREEVRGALLPVDGDGTVRTAYAEWDQAPCSIPKANGVVRSINDLVDTYRAGGGLPELRNVVLLGPDVAMPQMRVADESRLANESTFAEDMVFGNRDDPVSRAMRDGYVFTDDAYGDFDPQSIGSRALYIPDVALGRLLETPEDIERAVQAYVRNEGVLPRETAYVSGYDFLDDAAEAIFTGLQPLGFSTSVKLTGTRWDAQEGIAGMSVTGGISSVNAHFDTYRALPAKDFFEAGGGLMHATDVTPSPRTLLFTIGCHSGLNVAAKGLAGVDAADPRLDDWTQRVAGSGAPWVGQTGYGLGDSVALAYSERLMSRFAGLIGDQRANLGQSLMFAKQDYSGTSLGLFDDYDVKTLQEAALYGLPTYVIHGGQTAASVVPEAGQRAAQPTARAAADVQAAADTLGEASTERFVFSSTGDDGYVRETTERGEYWRVRGHEPLVIARRPIQPRWTTDVTAADGLPVHGALVDDLTMAEFGGIDPVIVRPIVDLSEHEPEPEVLDSPFPATLAAVAPYLAPDGRHDRLTLFTGQFRPEGGTGSGTQRTFTGMVGRTLRSASDDYDPPGIERADAAVVDETVTFSVETLPGDGGVGGTVLYRTGDAAGGSIDWKSAALTPAGTDRLSAGAVLPAGDDRVVEWIAQVADGAGNVGTSTNKVLGYAARPAEPVPGAPTVRFSGTTLEPSGAYPASPSIDLQDAGSATYDYSVDDGAWQRYEGAFSIDGIRDGAHVVRFRGSGGERAEGAFIVDSQPPTITASPQTSPGPGGWWPGDVAIDFACADAGAGIEPGACPASVTLTEEGANDVQRSVTDRAGRSSGVITFGPYRIDRTAPDQPSIDDGSERVELVGDDRLRGTASDEPSGVREVVVTFTELQGDALYTDPGKGRVVTRTTACDPIEGALCAWSVPRPPDGYWRADVAARDQGGNQGQAATVEVTSAEPCFDCDAAGSFGYEDFSSLQGLRLNGHAAQDGNAVRLTTDTQSQKGSVFRARPIDTTKSFEVTARFDAGGAADGLAFVLHDDREVATAVGAHGGGIGYHGLTPSIEVEYDTFPNSEFEPFAEHIAIHRNGNHEDELDLETTPLTGGERCTTIRYDAGDDLLEAAVFECGAPEPSVAQVSYAVDLTTALGPTAFIGWTAATGAVTGRHELRSWSYASEVANLVDNGSFEAPDVAVGTFAILPNGEVPGWAITDDSSGTGIEIQDRLASPAPDGGQQFVELDSDGTTRIYQDIPTIPGRTYMLRFQASPRPGQPAAEHRFRLSVGPIQGKVAPNDFDHLTYDGIAGGTDTAWQPYLHQFTAASGVTRIILGDQGLSPDNSYGMFIDTVRVLPVP